MRRFYFDRQTDVSGLSGTGAVVEGVQFSNGQVVIHWLTSLRSSMTIYESIEMAIAIHGHGGSTDLRWYDEQPSSIGEAPAASGRQRMTALLREPLARALRAIDPPDAEPRTQLLYIGYSGYEQSRRDYADAILAALAADPAVVQAIRPWVDQVIGDEPSPEQCVAALFGEPRP